MKTMAVKMILVRYNALTGLLWLIFWAYLAFFLGVLLEAWTLESQTTHWGWIASAILITLRRPFKTVTVMKIKLPIVDKDTAP